MNVDSVKKFHLWLNIVIVVLVFVLSLVLGTSFLRILGFSLIINAGLIVIWPIFLLGIFGLISCIYYLAKKADKKYVNLGILDSLIFLFVLFYMIGKLNPIIFLVELILLFISLLFSLHIMWSGEYCPKCGQKLNKGDKFCNKCGGKVK
jgi:hypothetical protein